MSSIAFHSPTRRVRVSGRERAMMGGLCGRFLKMQMGDLDYDDLAWVPYVFPVGHYLHGYGPNPDHTEMRRNRRAVETFFSVGDTGSGGPILDGEAVDVFCLALNSALQWGNPAIQLAAKLHGQCEIHAYVEGADREWLAALIDEAVEADVFRPDAWGYDGWGGVVAMLRETDAEPVVTSYSVTDSFPNPSFIPEIAALDPDDQWEAWEKLSERDQWDRSMAGLRNEPGLQLSPARLANPFLDGMAGREFMRRARALIPPDTAIAA